MGFLSKLLGDAAGKAAKDMLNGILNEQSSQTTEATGTTQSSSSDAGVSGQSWGDRMPSEANQYNYNGSYTSYFEEIFYTVLPEYRVEKTMSDYPSAIGYIYTFYHNGAKALVVELISERSSVYRLRHECEKANIPYLRFYYDHKGWWNTRSYVTEKLTNAVRG